MENDLAHKVILEMRPIKILEIVGYLKNMGLVSTNDFIFSYNPEKITEDGIQKPYVEFKFRDPQYASYIAMKWGSR